ncbi:PREDICTED: calcium-dependent secretion activator 1-like [Acropora digitifera]|uniref:calcium-dependent secretion activator 1-like n=1 Tax=Acropora digitifera TaxID=70779 RepID=UPI00077A6D60|nr:PREDICTED: calcium-dependent secretion activator 1-like [Acropora digitifera]
MRAASSDEEESEDVVDGDELTQELLKIYKRREQHPSIPGASALDNSRNVSPSLHSPSPTLSVVSEATLQEQQEDDERRERLQMYVFVLRCISYPFNARQPTDLARRHARVSKQDLDKIKHRFEDFLRGDTKIASDEAFFNAVRAYYDIFICSERVKKMVISGGCSSNDFREVFKAMIEKRVRSLPEINGISKETVLSSWMAKNDAIFRGEDDPKKGPRIAASAASELILSREQLYEMFQTILGVKKYEHQILFNACQLDSADEQAACIRRELDGRLKAIVNQRKVMPWKASREMFLFSPQHTISITEVTDDGDSVLSKSDVMLNFTIEVIVVEAKGLDKVLPSKRKVYCTMEVEGGEKFQTESAPAAEKASWDSQGDFTTCHPRPIVKVKLCAENTGLLALDDKELGKVIIEPIPGGSEQPELHDVIQPNPATAGKIKLKVAVKMDKPVNLKKCGKMYAQGKSVWKKWKERFYALVQVSHYTFAICSYRKKQAEPTEMMELDGYTVDYCEAINDEEHKGGRFFFKAVKEGDQVIFATEEELERQMWVNKLYTATGQSHKPVVPNLSAVSVQAHVSTLTRLQGDHDRARKHGLEDLIQADPSTFNHHVLFEKLLHLTLTHRLSDSYSCLGWFSPGQVFVLDEYCARYGVRGCQRHLSYLSDLLDRAEAGVMIDPTLLHYSFAFCASHVHGNRPDGIGTITVDEKNWFEEIKIRLWNLLSYQITHYRYSFPFGRPEGALKATLSLFERHAEALLWVSDQLIEHQEIFWSLFTVDLDAILAVQPPDTWESFQLYQLLNDYLSSDGADPGEVKWVNFGINVHTFPSNIRALERKHFFPLYSREGCRSSEELFWKLTVLQQFIAELNWPDEVLASHLMKRLKLMASDMVQSCVKRTKVSFEKWLKSNKFSVDLVVSRTVCVMFNVVIQAKRQSRFLCAREESENTEYCYHSDVYVFLKEVIAEMTSSIILKLNEVIESLLSKLARYDQGSILAPVLSLSNPGTDLEDNYLQFFKLNLQQLRSHLKDDKMKKQLIKDWYTSVVTKICDWLSDRMSMALHQFQIQALLTVAAELPQFVAEDLLHGRIFCPSYRTVVSRLRVEDAMQKGQSIYDIEDQPYPVVDKDDEEEDTESSDEEPFVRLETGN